MRNIYPTLTCAGNRGIPAGERRHDSPVSGRLAPPRVIWDRPSDTRWSTLAAACCSRAPAD